MKKYSTVIVLVIAIGLGLAAVLLVNKWLSARASQAAVEVRESMPMTRVVIAAQDMSPGTRLSEANLTLAEWPRATVPKGAFDSIDSLKDRIAVSKLSAGEPLLAAELAAPGSGAGLVAIIAPGSRAMAIRVDEVIGVGGFILPNTTVDVIGVQDIGDKQKKAETLLKKIKVLAVAQETQTEDGKAKLVRTVTLEIRPKDAEKLALQVNLGPIHLVLRNPLEEDETPPPPKVVVAKKSAPVPVVAPRVVAPPPPKFKVEVIQGDKAAEKYEFPAR